MVLIGPTTSMRIAGRVKAVRSEEQWLLYAVKMEEENRQTRMLLPTITPKKGTVKGSRFSLQLALASEDRAVICL